jgi:1-acyl-sn-glycerol-3-phosphate acyltransferase
MNKDQYLQILRSEFSYQSPSRRGLPAKYFRGWLTFIYYIRIVSIFTHASILARRGKLDNERWAWFSYRILKTVESVGGRVHISGLESVARCQGPLVYIGNHMSLLETLLMPGIALAFNKVTFVIKEELRHYPIVGHVMRALKLIAVSRKNPREDLKVVLREGHKFIANGGSIVIFPQATRSVEFDAQAFNTLGVKLASRAGVPVIPVAIKTDFQSNGKLIKDMGRVYPERTLYLKFGEPISVEGKGRQAHQQVIDFISQNITAWGGKVKGNSEAGIRNSEQ